MGRWVVDGLMDEWVDGGWVDGWMDGGQMMDGWMVDR